MSSLIPWVGAGGAWDPFEDLCDPFGGGGGRSGWLWSTSGQRGRDDVTAIAQARVDWRETDNAHVITAEIPGVRKEEVKVEVEDGNILKISGERRREEEEKTDTWHRVERRWGNFVRRFRLPENAKMDEVKCNLENGVLNVTIPKKETTPAGSNVRTIDIS